MKKKALIIGGVVCVIAVVIITVTLLIGKEDTSLTPVITGAEYNEDYDYNKYLLNPYSESHLAEVEDGFYYLDGILMYYDKNSKKTTYVCSKPNCPHTPGSGCEAYLWHSELHYYNGKLYFISGGIGSDHNSYLSSINLDGSNEQVVMILEKDQHTMWRNNDTLIIHRGIVYYRTSTGEIMANKLGADVENAVPIFKEDLIDLEFDGNGGQILALDSSRKTLYADGDYIYMRLMLQKDDGYVETFFRYNAVTRKSEKIFEIPSEEEVGSWEETGVQSEGWYISGDYIYYFLSGNGLWKYNMETKENTKVIDTKDKGLGTIDDKYLYINNGGSINNTQSTNEVSESQIDNLCIKIYDLKTGEMVGKINYADIYKNKEIDPENEYDGTYNDFRIVGVAKDGIFLRANTFLSDGVFFYADLTDVKNAKFELIPDFEGK